MLVEWNQQGVLLIWFYVELVQERKWIEALKYRFTTITQKEWIWSFFHFSHHSIITPPLTPSFNRYYCINMTSDNLFFVPLNKELVEVKTKSQLRNVKKALSHTNKSRHTGGFLGYINQNVFQMVCVKRILKEGVMSFSFGITGRQIYEEINTRLFAGKESQKRRIPCTQSNSKINSSIQKCQNSMTFFVYFLFCFGLLFCCLLWLSLPLVFILQIEIRM